MVYTHTHTHTHIHTRARKKKNDITLGKPADWHSSLFVVTLQTLRAHTHTRTTRTHITHMWRHEIPQLHTVIRRQLKPSTGKLPYYDKNTHTHTPPHTHIHPHPHPHRHTHIHPPTQTHTRTLTHTHTYTPTPTPIHPHTHTYTAQRGQIFG